MQRRADGFVPLAEVSKPHGLRGDLRLKLYNRESDVVPSLREARLELPTGEVRTVKVLRARPAGVGMLMAIDGCTTYEAANLLRGAQILVHRDALPTLPDGEFYAFDVEGARVLVGDEEVGRVEEMVTYPTCDVLVVATPKGRVEIPLVEGVIDNVDVALGVVRLSSREVIESP